MKQSAWFVGSTESATEHIIAISEYAEQIVQIDEKYLPKASEDGYGVIKTSDVISAYYFPVNAPHDKMVDAIAEFNAGKASIMWSGYKVISAHYNSSDDTISVIFANTPATVKTFQSIRNEYYHTLGSSTYDEFEGGSVRIVKDNDVYATLSVKGELNNETLTIGVKKITIGAIYGMSTTGIILHSSTEGSNKRFKITVDDSGTISATETEEIWA